MPGSKSTPRSGVFISYARSDGEKFANVLRQRLEAEGIPLWQDRVGMEGGRDWWLQITEALDRVEFMALVITPNALKSDTVRKEWRYARQQGVCVYPIKGSPDLDFDSLPRWMASAHFYDIGTVKNHLNGPEWKKFVNDLNASCQTKRVPFMVEDLPEGFVGRPGEFDQLLKLLIDERREEPVAITAALRGAGGYGKTTLAKALCHDERIQDAFDDGVLWVTLGENPGDLTGRVEDLIVTLGDERPDFTTQDAAVNRLKELLADRDILIVIDDVWDRAHLNPFIQGGPRCARLITTRNFDTLPAGATRVHVDAMQQDEATTLLAAGLDELSLDDERVSSELKKLASRLGEWPLLLRLVNSALRNRIENDKQSPRDAIAWINKALTKRGLTYFDAHNSEARQQAVVKTIGVSLDLLSARDRERYGELAIFPEDVEIPLATLEKLWARTGGFDEFDTEELCSRLNRFSLLWNYDANQRRIRLHDVVRKFLIEQQGDKLPSIHTQLLDAHRPATSSRWAEMPAEEPYLWDQLAYHLIEAGRSNELVTNVKDWRYLVAKTLRRKSLAVESDLLAAEKCTPHNECLRLLRRNFANSAHILNRCESRDEIEVTLFSRLQHLGDLRLLTTDLEQHLKRPYFAPIKLPDLPHSALIRTLSGHAHAVTSCAVSADGQIIISASDDYTVKVWDGQSGQERFTLSGHSSGVNCCAVSADGTTIISGSYDKMLKVWNAINGMARFTLGHHDWVNSCAVSTDGTIIVSAGYWSLKVWNGRKGAELFTLRGHSGRIRGCAVSSDGRTIVSASDDKTVKVWDGQSGKECFTLSGHSGGVNSCTISEDGATIISASDDTTLKVWDARTGVERFTLSGHAARVTGCAVSADGATVVSSSYDRTLKLWDGYSGIERYTLRGHANVVNSCALSSDGANVVSASDDKTLRIWEGRSGSERFTLTDHAEGVRGCAVSADGTTIASVSYDHMLQVWDGGKGAERFKLSDNAVWDNGCSLSMDGKTIISADRQQVNVWDGQSGAKRFKLSRNTARVWAMSADGTVIASVSDSGTLKIWDGQSGAEGLTLSTYEYRGWDHSDYSGDCAVSADGTTIVCLSGDKKVDVWGGSGAKRFTLSDDTPYTGCTVSADGRTIVSANYWAVKLWNGWTGAERVTLIGDGSGVSGWQLSADGTTIIVASTDQIFIWNESTATEHITLKGQGLRVGDCAISANGETVISATSDQTLKVWDGRTGECLAILHVDGSLNGCACSADGEIIAAAGARGVYFVRLVR